MGKIILRVNKNYSTKMVKEYVEKAISEMRLTKFIDKIEFEKDKGSYIKIGKPISLSEMDKIIKEDLRD